MARLVSRAHVGNIANNALVTVEPTMKLDDVAKLFEKHRISASPVVDGLGKCIGIITNRDLVRYESLRNHIESQHLGGLAFDVTKTDVDVPLAITSGPFDEVAYHMTSEFVTIGTKDPLSYAGRLMCREHVHHLLVLDEAGRPTGILSTLDVLSEVLGESISKPHFTNAI